MPLSSETGTVSSEPLATSRTRTCELLIVSRMRTVRALWATTLPGATSNRSGVSGLRLVTTKFPRSLIVEG
jgi:hypothetical protein